MGSASDRRSRYLTVAWNNALTAVFGIPMLAYAIVGVSTNAVSDRAAFVGTVLIGAVY